MPNERRTAFFDSPAFAILLSIVLLGVVCWAIMDFVVATPYPL
jgi:hypothetical protein